MLYVSESPAASALLWRFQWKTLDTTDLRHQLAHEGLSLYLCGLRGGAIQSSLQALPDAVHSSMKPSANLRKAAYKGKNLPLTERRRRSGPPSSSQLPVLCL